MKVRTKREYIVWRGHNYGRCVVWASNPREAIVVAKAQTGFMPLAIFTTMGQWCLTTGNQYELVRRG